MLRMWTAHCATKQTETKVLGSRAATRVRWSCVARPWTKTCSPGFWVARRCGVTWGGTHGWVGYRGELWYHYPGEAGGAVVPGPSWHGRSEFTLHLPERTGFCWHASNGFKWGSHYFFYHRTGCLSIFTIFYRPRSCLGCWAAAGLLVPTGQNNVRVLNGSSHGKGIYTAKTQNTAPQLAAVHMHHHASTVYWYMNLHVQVYACSRVSSWWFQLLSCNDFPVQIR